MPLLTPAQSQIASDTHRFRVINCGRRFGKTTLAVEEIKALALSKPSRIAYIAPTFQQARDIAWQMLIKELKPIILKVNESRLELEVRTLSGESSLIILRGWEAIETLRGQYFDFIVIDEVASMRNFWLLWQEVVRPTLTDRRGQAMFISTPKGFNHFYDLYNIENDPVKGKDYKSFHFTSYDNSNVPPEEIDAARNEMTEDRFAQEYMADFRKTEGLVYKDFSREKHVTDQFPENFTEVLGGIDWGFRNPASAHRLRKDYDNNYWIDRELYKKEITTEEICQHVLDFKPNKVYPDPAEADRCDIARKMGLNVRSASKDVEAGINTLQDLFRQGRIKIHPDCKFLIQELETYRYGEKKSDQNEKEAPIKENDHACDEIRYVIHTEELKHQEDEPRDEYYAEYGTYYID